MMKSIKKVTWLIMEVDGRYVRADGFPTDPLNAKRIVNTSKLTNDILEAKNFYFFQEDISATLAAFPTARKLVCNFDIAYYTVPMA